MSMRTRLVLILLPALIIALLLWRERAPAHTDVLHLYGDVDIREVDLAFRQGGRLAAMLVDEGDQVHAGQLLATLDATPLREALLAARATTAQAQAQLLVLEHGNRPQEIAAARQEVAQAQAVAVNDAHEYQRQRLLQTDGTSSLRQIEAARASRDAAQAQWRADVEKLNLLLAGARREDIAAARARWQAAQATQAQAATALADTRLYAPADAQVFSRVLEPGSMVAPNTPVYILSLRQPVYVRTYVGESDLAYMQPGRAVWVTHDGSQRRYAGHIGFVAARAEFTPKTVETPDLRTDLVYRIRISIDQPDASLRQGMPVSVDVPLGRGRHGH